MKFNYWLSILLVITVHQAYAQLPEATIVVGGGPTMNRDFALTDWFSKNGLGGSRPTYWNVDILMLFKDGINKCGGLKFNFGGASHSYPSKLEVSLCYGYYFNYHGVRMMPTLGAGISSSRIGFSDSIPAILYGYHFSRNASLKQFGLLINPSLKMFKSFGKDNWDGSRKTIGIDVGANIYLFPSQWKYKDFSHSQSPSAFVPGIPDASPFTVYITILFGLSL